jgi:hypothetical protein
LSCERADASAMAAPSSSTIVSTIPPTGHCTATRTSRPVAAATATARRSGTGPPTSTARAARRQGQHRPLRLLSQRCLAPLQRGQLGAVWVPDAQTQQSIGQRLAARLVRKPDVPRHVQVPPGFRGKVPLPQRRLHGQHAAGAEDTSERQDDYDVRASRHHPVDRHHRADLLLRRNAHVGNSGKSGRGGTSPAAGASKNITEQYCDASSGRAQPLGTVPAEAAQRLHAS